MAVCERMVYVNITPARVVNLS